MLGDMARSTIKTKNHEKISIDLLLHMAFKHSSLYADGKGFPLAPMAEYYVDFVNGNDSNPGTSAGIAFKTLARARDEVASINANMTGDIIVYLRKERHEIDATVLFDSNDSGTNGHHIIYRNYQMNPQF